MAPAPPDEVPVRDAATIVLVRSTDGGPHVLMGQRGASAAFMPNKFVFPGGRVDEADRWVVTEESLEAQTAVRLAREAPPGLPTALAAAAIRELWEETGLALARAAGGPRTGPTPAGWEQFFAAGYAPDPAPLRFFFRAITPPGRPRRFDARFFLCDAAALAGDPDDFSRAGSELSHLRWLPLAEARALDLPFITEVVLAELGPLLGPGGEDRPVPFFDHGGQFPRFRAL